MNRDEYAIMYGVEESHWWYQGLRGMLREFAKEIPKDARILDIGCGTGANMQSLGYACGIDFSPQAIQFCRERGLAKTAVASGSALPFPDATFDAAVSCDVLCHHSFPDKAVALQEFARVIRPGGYILINLPAYQWLKSSHDDHVGTDKRFNMRETEELLTTAGLKCLRKSYWNTVLFPLAAAVRLWRRFRPPNTSDLAAPSGASTSSIIAPLLSLERTIARITPLPIGLSLMMLARKE